MSLFTAEEWLLLALLLPVAGGFALLPFARRPNLREGVTLITTIATFYSVWQLYPLVDAGVRPELKVIEVLPGLELAFQVEPLGMVYALLASFLWIVTTLYAIGYMRGHHERNQTRFYHFFALSIAAALGVAFSANMFTLFIFYELLTLATFPLVTHAGSDRARRAGRVYLGILLGTSVAFQLLAIVITWFVTGSLDFREGGVFGDQVPATTIVILYALFVFGVGKAALMPFHRWLPAAMVAPTPVSALLHAVAVVKAGVFTILKLTIYLFGLERLNVSGAADWLVWVAAATILIASLVAMTRDNLKARLAYSTISQLSYIVLGALLLTPLGVLGGAMHIVTHAFGKITLFFCAGAIMVATHKSEISQMDGIGRTMPITMAAFLIGALSIIGLPPMGGMWSKWFLAMGTLDNGQLVLLGVLMVSSLLNIAYLLPIPIRAFFVAPAGDDGHEWSRKRGESVHQHGFGYGGRFEAPLPSLIALSFTALMTVVIFLYPDPLYQLLMQLPLSR